MEAVIKTEALKKLVEQSLDNSKGLEIVTVPLKGKTEIADYMIVASGTSGRHVISIAERLIEDLGKEGLKGLEVEGKNTAEWVLVDLFDIIVHVFIPEAREKYDIEAMWQMPAEKKERKARKKAAEADE